MSLSNIYITPSTSLILIKSLARQPVVLLSTFSLPDFRVNIRDTTGLASQLLTTPIVISTTGLAKFVDNSTSYPIDKPYGFVNLSLRTSTLWQILHTSGQSPVSSAANVNVTNISSSYIGLLSSASKQVSSLQIENLDTPNSITLTGPFVIGNLSTPGFILLKSTLNVYGNASFDKTTFVSGATTFLSSLYVESINPLSSPIYALSSMGVGGSIFVRGQTIVFSTLQTQSSLQVQTMAVQRSTTSLTVDITGSAQVAGLVSSLGRLTVLNQTLVQQDVQISHTFSSLGGLVSTKTLEVRGDVTLFSTLSTIGNAEIFSSFTTLSSVQVRNNLSFLSTVFVTNLLSTPLIDVNYFSTSASVSSAGALSMNTLTVNETLSTQRAIIQSNFTTSSLFVSQDITVREMFSTNLVLGFPILHIYGNADLKGLKVNGPLNVGGNAFVGQTMATQAGTLYGDVTANGSMTVTESARFSANVGIGSNLAVTGTLKVLGFPNIGSYDADSFSVSSLQVMTSSPSIALRASTFTLGTLRSSEIKLAYNSNIGNVNFGDYRTSLFANEIYTQSVKGYRMSTNSLYAENVVTRNPDSTPTYIFPNESYPVFQIASKASFPRGLSTKSVYAYSVTAQSTIGTFVGDASLLANVPLLFSTISTGTARYSTINTSTFSTVTAYLGNATVSTNLFIRDSLLFNTPSMILSTGLTVSPSIYTTYNTTKIPVIQPVNVSTLGINDTMYLNSFNRRVGILTSTPVYNFDISGSLYFTGNLFYTSQNSLNFSTTKSAVTFSTLYYSSIRIRDSLILGKNETFPMTKYLGIGQTGTSNAEYGLYIGESITPQYEPITGYTGGNFRNLGIFTNPTNSTLDINYSLFLDNPSKTATLGCIVNTVTNFISPPIPNPGTDLTVQGDFKASTLTISTVAVSGKITTSTLEMPKLGINTNRISTFNTLSTSYFTTPSSFNTSFYVNNCLELFKNYEQTGQLFVRRPLAHTYEIENNITLSVHSQAFVSSITSDNIYTNVYFFQTEDL
jgi:hypothetical protein